VLGVGHVWELVVVLLALIVFGPKRLPVLGEALGHTSAEDAAPTPRRERVSQP
jgi:hypothetical protein